MIKSCVSAAETKLGEFCTFRTVFHRFFFPFFFFVVEMTYFSTSFLSTSSLLTLFDAIVGDITLSSMEGFGTDAYLHIPRLGTNCEALPAPVQMSPGELDSTYVPYPGYTAY